MKFDFLFILVFSSIILHFTLNSIFTASFSPDFQNISRVHEKIKIFFSFENFFLRNLNHPFKLSMYKTETTYFSHLLQNKKITLISKQQLSFEDQEIDDFDIPKSTKQPSSDSKVEKNIHKKRKDCPPNSTMNSDGFCECESGFIGFPNDQRGCYRCPEQCYEDEICVYPGVCSCAFGKMRAPNDECVSPSLRMIRAFPTLIDRQYNGFITVEVEPKEVTIRPLFCKFGQTVLSAGKGTKPGEIFCPLPMIKKMGDTRLFVSDDRSTWPAHGILLRITKSAGNEFTNDVIIGTIFSILMCLITLVIFWKFFKSETARAARKRTEIETYN